mmetsp:Transcript_24171/g.75163  ORF Transcript_24171/g.75163 Transcript_24171/m.75163 type:complete len:274 (+) Transcript_24171:929-1750(+)
MVPGQPRGRSHGPGIPLWPPPCSGGCRLDEGAPAWGLLGTGTRPRRPWPWAPARPAPAVRSPPRPAGQALANYLAATAGCTSGTNAHKACAGPLVNDPAMPRDCLLTVKRRCERIQRTRPFPRRAHRQRLAMPAARGRAPWRLQLGAIPLPAIGRWRHPVRPRLARCPLSRCRRRRPLSPLRLRRKSGARGAGSRHRARPQRRCGRASAPASSCRPPDAGRSPGMSSPPAPASTGRRRQSRGGGSRGPPRRCARSPRARRSSAPPCAAGGPSP